MTDDQLRAAHGAVCEALRRSNCLAAPVPTSLDLCAVARHWGLATTQAAVRAHAARLALVLADT